MTQRELDNLVRRWQETLGLRDWAITARITREPSQDDEKSFSDAWATIDPNNRVTEVWLLDGSVAKSRPNRLVPWKGYEPCLVHEILHIWFGMAATCEVCEEQAINALMGALVGR